MTTKWDEVFDLIHQAVELALKAKELAKEAALVVASAKRTEPIIRKNNQSVIGL